MARLLGDNMRLWNGKTPRVILLYLTVPSRQTHIDLLNFISGSYTVPSR